MPPPSCAAALVIMTCVVLQALGVSLHWHVGNQRACLQQHQQDVLCLAWSPAVETAGRAG